MAVNDDSALSVVNNVMKSGGRGGVSFHNTIDEAILIPDVTTVTRMQTKQSD